MGATDLWLTMLSGIVGGLLLGMLARWIGDDVVVHSRFKGDDLRLLCRAFAGYAKSGYAGSDVKACQKLFKRMMRKVK